MAELVDALDSNSSSIGVWVRVPLRVHNTLALFGLVMRHLFFIIQLYWAIVGIHLFYKMLADKPFPKRHQFESHAEWVEAWRVEVLSLVHLAMAVGLYALIWMVDKGL